MIAVSFFGFYALALLVGTLIAQIGGNRSCWENLPVDGPVRIIPIVVTAPTAPTSPTAPTAHRWQALDAIAQQVATRSLVRAIVRDLQAEGV